MLWILVFMDLGLVDATEAEFWWALLGLIGCTRPAAFEIMPCLSLSSDAIFLSMIFGTASFKYLACESEGPFDARDEFLEPDDLWLVEVDEL